jgi:transposase
MHERLKSIARLLDGEKMAGLRREFGISGKTGYRILTRYNEIGLDGLTDRSPWMTMTARSHCRISRRRPAPAATTRTRAATPVSPSETRRRRVARRA